MFSGKRSPEANLKREQRRKAKQVMLDNAFNDRMNGDVVNLLHWEQVVNILTVDFGSIEVGAVPCSAERGCVLSDPYGRGAFQQ